MRRSLGVLPLVALLAACPSYDRDRPISSEKGLVPPDVFARYGAEPAQAVAIGRALGAATAGRTRDEVVRAMPVVAEYARSMPDVVSVQSDPHTRLLTVTFRSGWQKAVTPITDGVPASRTPGAPPVH